MSAKQITKLLKTAGIEAGFEAGRNHLEVMIADTDREGVADYTASEELFDKIAAIFTAAGIYVSAYRTGYGAWEVAIGNAGRAQAQNLRSIELDQFGIEA